MSILIFDGTFHTLSLVVKNNDRTGDGKHKIVGSWPANNFTEIRPKATKENPNPQDNIVFLPDGHYTIAEDTRSKPQRHDKEEDSITGLYGSYGIILIETKGHAGLDGHSGIGIHAGRYDKGRYNHATDGCIRTNEPAMHQIVETMAQDPLEHLIVRRNHSQRDDKNREGAHRGVTLPSLKAVASGAPPSTFKRAAARAIARSA